MPHIEVKNWQAFQHYKHRNPPWIRLYIRCLDDVEFARLPDVTKAHLVAIWMLAGRYHNQIPADLAWVENKMNATEPVNWQRLLSDGWVTYSGDASELLATCKQNATTEQIIQNRAECPENSNGAHAPTRRQNGTPRRKHDREAWMDRLAEVFASRVGIVPDSQLRKYGAPVVKLLGEQNTLTAADYYVSHADQIDGEKYIGLRSFAQKAAWCLKQVTPVSGDDALKLVQR